MKAKKTKVNIFEGGIGSSPSFNERVKAPALIETASELLKNYS